MISEQCQQCRFWDRYVDGGLGALNATLGDCRRAPPAISEQILARTMPGYASAQLDDLELNVYSASAFPVTDEESWCGQFEAMQGTLVAVLTERNALVDHIGDDNLSGEDEDRCVARLNRLDNYIVGAPASNKDDVFAKLLLVAQLQVEGHDTPRDRAAAIVREAHVLAGIERAPPAVTPPILETVR